jgi:hypothetical protein
MFDIILDNEDNDKVLLVKLPIVPRIGDWIKIDYEDDFCSETLMFVRHVILSESEIKVCITSEDE